VRHILSRSLVAWCRQEADLCIAWRPAPASKHHKWQVHIGGAFGENRDSGRADLRERLLATEETFAEKCQDTDGELRQCDGQVGDEIEQAQALGNGHQARTPKNGSSHG
jgi:hypothetical protein